MKRQLITCFTCIVLAITTHGCLKTRAQLRGDSSDDGDPATAQPIPAQVKDVQPQGQYVIDEIKSELTRLTGRIEDLEREGQQARNSGGSRQEETKRLEARIVELEQTQAVMIETIKKLQTSVPATAESPELFEKGKREYQASQYDAAVETLGGYLKFAGAKHTEEATFLRAEALFHLRQYKKAIVDYSKFPERYNRSKRMPQVLFKIGLAFEALGMKDDAIGFFQELVEKYPKSPEAKKAKAKYK